MKVLYISTSQGNKGGGESYFLILAQQFCKKKSIVIEVAMSKDSSMDFWERELGELGVIIHRIPIHNLYHYKTRCIGCSLDPRNKWVIRRLIDHTKPTIVHVNQQNMEDGLDIVLAAESKMPGRVVGTIHNAQILRSLVTHGRAIREWWSARFHAKVKYHRIFVSHASKRSFEQSIPAYVGWNHVVWNGLPAHTYLANFNIRRLAKSSFGIDGDTFVVGFIGRLSSQKNLRLAIRAFSRLSVEEMKAVFLIAGEGEDGDGLREYAREVGITERLRWLGYLPEGEKDTFYRAIDLFVLPSRFEGFPSVVIEALMRGVPVIATAVDGNVEALEFGRAGWLVPPDDLQALTNAIRLMYHDRELRRKYGEKGQKYAGKRLTSNAMAERTYAVYLGVLNGASDAGS